MTFVTHKYNSGPAKSRIKGHCEQGFWKPLKYRWGQYFDAIDAFQKKHKAPGERFGPLGPVARDVFRVLVQRTGRKGVLELSLETIARLAGCCKSAVVNALKLLRKYGFVRWINRYVIASEDDMPPGIWGPQVWQTTNAYAVDLPPEAVALVPPSPPKTPADEEARRVALVSELRNFEAQENGVGDAIDRLGRAVHNWKYPPEN
jgi:hypothetical protein